MIFVEVTKYWANLRFQVTRIASAAATPLAGTFTLAFSASSTTPTNVRGDGDDGAVEFTSPIPWDASASAVQSSLEALKSVGRVQVNSIIEITLNYRFPE